MHTPVRLERKWSLIGGCSGIIAGLVGITPAAGTSICGTFTDSTVSKLRFGSIGFVGSPAALCIGVVTSTACNLATKVKFWVRVDDALDVWAVHAVGGMFGAVLTGLFADARVVSFDGITEIDGGWINVSSSSTSCLTSAAKQDVSPLTATPTASLGASGLPDCWRLCSLRVVFDFDRHPLLHCGTHPL